MSNSEKMQGIVAVLRRANRFLVGKRSMHKKTAPGYWCPVSGKMESRESQEQAVVREVFEETGLHVEAVRCLCSFDTRDGSTLLHWWLVRELAQGELKLNHEHSEMRWVSLEEMRDLQPFFPEDLAVFEGLADK